MTKSATAIKIKYEDRGNTRYFQCKKCDEFKTKEFFRKRTKMKHGIEGICKSCQMIANKKNRKSKSFKIPREIVIPPILFEAFQFKVRADGKEAVSEAIRIPRHALTKILYQPTSKVSIDLFERICLYTGRNDFMDEIGELDD